MKSFNNQDKGYIMDEIFQQLAGQVNSLIRNYRVLQNQNDYLQRGKQLLSREHEALLIRHKQAVKKIENMLVRLKSIEGLL